MSYVPVVVGKNSKNAVEVKEYMIKKRLYPKAQPSKLKYKPYTQIPILLPY